MSDKLGRTPLILACQNNRLDEVRFLVEHGADPNDTDIYNNCALVYACHSRNPEIIKLVVNTVHIKTESNILLLSLLTVIDSGADVNAVNMFGDTILHSLCRVSYLEMPFQIIFLIENGANIFIQSRKGNTALDLALLYSNTYVVDYLLQFYDISIISKLLSIRYSTDICNTIAKHVSNPSPLLGSLRSLELPKALKMFETSSIEQIFPIDFIPEKIVPDEKNIPL